MLQWLKLEGWCHPKKHGLTVQITCNKIVAASVAMLTAKNMERRQFTWDVDGRALFDELLQDLVIQHEDVTG